MVVAAVKQQLNKGMYVCKCRTNIVRIDLFFLAFSNKSTMYCVNEWLSKVCMYNMDVNECNEEFNGSEQKFYLFPIC